ncbi:tRNA U34 carboxymethyltransferase, partial [Frankliniella fusca]
MKCRKREKHFPEWESNLGPLGSVLRALPTEPRRFDDCLVRRVRVVFALSPSLQPGGFLRKPVIFLFFIFFDCDFDFFYFF